ncbi:hypothetical protein BV898_01878 [Hypsibius exemplaris]|uniref:Uncharacterized protein n=1 Tax=Hypsibius exemplaris TaxID=2072580 RepID=A0A1W0XAA6_HYPEX|nr:hypothetical protein BV898_01878 [Hypsibius exemplaris]
MDKSRTGVHKSSSRSNGRAKKDSSSKQQQQVAKLAAFYTGMLERLDKYVANYQAQFRQEMMDLGITEEDCFTKTCNLYTNEQLGMTVVELEEALKLDEEVREVARKEEQQRKSDMRKSRVMFRVPMVPVKKSAKRRSSIVVGIVPVCSTAFRKVPSGMKRAGSKTAATPRHGRLGEIAYSAQGSPIRIDARVAGKGSYSKDGKVSAARLKMQVMEHTFAF